jgi:hypothetical protein
MANRGYRRTVKNLNYLLCVVILLATEAALLRSPARAAVGSGLETPAGVAATRVFTAWLEARKNFDFDKVRSLEADQSVFVEIHGTRKPLNDDRLRDIIQWEAGIHTIWTGHPLSFRDGKLKIELSESSDMSKILGIGSVSRYWTMQIENGKIVETRVNRVRCSGKNEDEVFRQFTQWISTQSPERQTGVLRDGRLIFDGESARRELILLRDWPR